MDPTVAVAAVSTLGTAGLVLAAVALSFNKGVQHGTVSAENRFLRAQIDAERANVSVARDIQDEYRRGVDSLPDGDPLVGVFGPRGETDAEVSVSADPA